MTDHEPLIAAMVLAAGSGTRLGTEGNKVYLDVGGRPVLAWSLATLDAHPRIGRLVVVVRPGDEALLGRVLTQVGPRTPLSVTSGGATRVASEHAGLSSLRSDIESGVVGWVVVHDGARPFVSSALIDRVVDAAVRHGAAVPGLAFDQPVYTHDAATRVAIELDRRRLRKVQTPQGFAARPLLAAYERAVTDQVDGVDTAEVAAHFAGLAARVVPGDVDNLKVTVPSDLPAAEAVAARIARSPS
jgi:2-C-methyl-D-erythritol 4-phosphate cytidylyltransferase